MSMKNILLLDTRVNEYEKIISAVNTDICTTITFDYYTDTLDDIKSKILTELSNEVEPAGTGTTVSRCIGLLQHNYNLPVYNIVQNLDHTGSVVTGVSDLDPLLETWSPLKNFISWCKTNQHVNAQYFDMMACAIYSNNDWKYVIDNLSIQTEVIIRASTDNTGSSLLGGNWFLESHTGVNLKDGYFTELIDEFYDILGMTSIHTMMLSSGGTYGTGTVYGCGRNSSGQLGLGDFTQRTTLTAVTTLPNNRTPIEVACGHDFTIVRMVDSFLSPVETLWGSGANGIGQIGIGTNVYVTSFTKLNTTNWSNKSPKSVSCGFAHTIVFMTDGTIFGTGNAGPIGSSQHRNILTQMPNTTGKTPVQVISGAGHTVVLMTDGTIYAVGDNANGQLGNGTTTGANTLTLMTNNTGRIPIRISAGEYQTVVLMADYSIYVTGGNFYGQLGIGTNGTGTNVTTLTLVNNTNWSGKVPRSISCGHTHMIVLMTDGTIFGTGLNSSGELGNGNNTNRNTLGLISNTTTKTIRTVSCAGNHTIFLMTDNTVWGTGYNGEGTLGDGTTTNRNTLTQLTSSSTYNIFQLCDTENTSVVLDTNGVTLKYVGISSAFIIDRMILIEANPMGTGMEWFAVTSNGAIMTPAGFKTEYNLYRPYQDWIEGSLSTDTNGIKDAFVPPGGSTLSHPKLLTVSEASSEIKDSAISTTGQYQIVSIWNGSIRVSNDFGSTWNPKISTKQFHGVAVSSTGQYQSACVFGEHIYTSDDYGVTWNQRSSVIRNHMKVKMSITGQYQTCVSDNNFIVTSSDYGVTWTEMTSVGSKSYYDIAMSYDGNIQYAVALNGGGILKSTDRWQTFTSINTGLYQFKVGSIETSWDGKYITIVQYTDTGVNDIVLLSSNGGTTWRSFDPDGSTRTSWTSSNVAMTANGKYQTITYSGGIYISWDYGNTWTKNTYFTLSPRAVSLSWDGKYGLIGNNNVDLYSLNSFSSIPMGNVITTRITNMSSWFYNTGTNPDISAWDTSNVTNMGGGMLRSTGLTRSINSWNVSKVTTMSNMFIFSSVFNQPLNNWNTSNVTDMSDMFGGTNIFNQNISNWNVDKVSRYSGFSTSLSSQNRPLFKQDPGFASSTFTVPSSKLTTDSAFNISVAPTSAVSNGAITYTSSAPSIATIHPTTGLITIVAVGSGSVTFIATIAATSQYWSETKTSNTLSIAVPLPTPTLVSSTFTVASSKTVLDASFAITTRPTSNSGAAITYTSNNPAVATIDASGNRITLVGTGTVTFAASQIATAQYSSATINSNQLTVSLATSTFSLETNYFTVPTGKNYGDASFAILTRPTITNSAGAITYTSNNTNVATIDASGNWITLVGVGDVSFNAVQAATSQYAAATRTSNTLTVYIGVPNIVSSTFIIANTSKSYGDPSFAILTRPTSNSSGVITYTSNNTAVATIDTSGNWINIVGVGDVSFNASQAAVPNQFIARTLTSDTLTVSLGTPTLSSSTFTVANTSKVYGDASFAILTRPTSNSSGAITYTSSNPAIATIDASGNWINIVGVGDVSFNASQAAVPNQFTSGSRTSGPLTISKGTPALAFVSPPSTKFITDASFSVSATSASAGAVSYSSSDISLATVHPSTGSVTLKAVGSVTITASQALTTLYNAPSNATCAISIQSAGTALQGTTVTSGTSYASLDLSGASLVGTTVSGVSFSGANLSNVDFSGAVVTGTDFTNVNLSGATNLPAFSPVQKLQLLKNINNTGIGQVQVSGTLSGSVISSLLDSPSDIVNNATFVVKAPASIDGSGNKVVSVSVSDISGSNSVYIPLNANESAKINNTVYLFNGSNIIDVSGNVVNFIIISGIPFKIYAGSIVAVNVMNEINKIIISFPDGLKIGLYDLITEMFALK